MSIPSLIQPYLHVRDGFCHPDWEGMATTVESHCPESQWSEAWTTAGRTWLEHVRDELGPSYQLHESPHFFVLTEAAPSVARDVCTFCESALQRIQKTFHGLGCDSLYGKFVVILVAQVEDYYRYILHFYPDGDHPKTGGVCLDRRGYPHIAIPTPDDASYRTTLVHQLTHAYFSRRHMPVWLSQALAMHMERAVLGTTISPLDRELRNRHLAYWNATTIQEFWSGASWQIPGESSELSDSLALLLWQRIEADFAQPPYVLFLFLGTAHRDNAGEDACQIYLEIGLADLVENFLGPGKWEPKPRRWKHRRKQEVSAPG